VDLDCILLIHVRNDINFQDFFNKEIFLWNSYPPKINEIMHKLTIITLMAGNLANLCRWIFFYSTGMVENLRNLCR